MDKGPLNKQDADKIYKELDKVYEILDYCFSFQCFLNIKKHSKIPISFDFGFYFDNEKLEYFIDFIFTFQSEKFLLKYYVKNNKFDLSTNSDLSFEYCFALKLFINIKLKKQFQKIKEVILLAELREIDKKGANSP